MPSKSPTPKQELLLKREASLAAMALGTGLTDVRRFNYAQTGYFYSGMYSYCIGLERVLKLVSVYDYRLNHNHQFPTNSILKAFGHGIADLIAQAESIAAARQLEIHPTYRSDALYEKIVPWLTDFAQSTRYYNLDTLTGRSHSTDEPLVRWEKEVCSVIIERHHRPSAARLQELEMVKARLESFAHVRHTSGSGMQLNDVSSAVDESSTSKVKQKFSMYYLYQLSRFACEVLRELEYEGNFFPTL